VSKPRGYIGGSVSEETGRALAWIWAQWLPVLTPEAAADADSPRLMLTRIERWGMPHRHPEASYGERRPEPCAWRDAGDWCQCFRCECLNAIEMCARELHAGRAPLVLADEHLATARALAAQAPKWLERKGKARRRGAR
jgi:hypothetical protein